MKTQEEIEKLAEKEYREYPNNPLDEPAWHYNKDIHCHKKRKAFINGYTQCQEDMAIENKMLGDRLWRMSNSAEDWMNKHKSASKKLKLIEASINGSLDGIEFDNNSDVIEKSFVIDMLNDLKKLLNKQDDENKEEILCPKCGGDSWKFNDVKTTIKYCKCGNDF